MTNILKATKTFLSSKRGKLLVSLSIFGILIAGTVSATYLATREEIESPEAEAALACPSDPPAGSCSGGRMPMYLPFKNSKYVYQGWGGRITHFADGKEILALDLVNSAGDYSKFPVYAGRSGEIFAIKRNGSSGSTNLYEITYIGIKHSNYGLYSWYLHIVDIPGNLSTGQQISAGTLLGNAGNTGTTFNHLHFQVNADPNGWRSLIWNRYGSGNYCFVEYGSNGTGRLSGNTQSSQNSPCAERCTPNCSNKQCGSNDGCGGTCSSGSCNSPPSGAPYCNANNTKLVKYNSTGTCSNNSCQYSTSVVETCSRGCNPSTNTCISCTPNCGGKSCGDDGCGGICGICNTSPTKICQNSTTLRTYDSVGTCSGSSCTYSYSDTNCAYGCDNSHCTSCTPNCTNRECGDDSCGGDCGPCDNGDLCLLNKPNQCGSKEEAGDINADGRIDHKDLSSVLSNWKWKRTPRKVSADLNQDGTVNARDLATILNNWKKTF